MKSKLLETMFRRDNLEQTIDKLVNKGVNKAELRMLCKTDTLLDIIDRIANETLEFPPAHQAAIPKNDGSGEMRIVYVGETIERFICSLINDSLFELCPQLVHKSCKSYQKGLGCNKTVNEFSNMWGNNYGKYQVVKTDYHHYFDDILKEKVFAMLDKIEHTLGNDNGTEPVINLLRKMFNNDLLFDLDKNLISKWSGIRQGNAVGSFLADAILYDIDEYMSNKYPFYVRYSDDSICLTDNANEVIDDLTRMISEYGVSLNPKKVEVVTDKFIKFLGFSVNGYQISLSKSRLKSFQKDVQSVTIKKRQTKAQAINKVNRLLYKGNGEHSWAEQVLGVVNCERDLNLMNEYIMDCIRAVERKRHKVGGLGYEQHPDGIVTRGLGRHVSENMIKTEKEIDGYYSLMCMRKALVFSKDLYNTLVLSM